MAKNSEAGAFLNITPDVLNKLDSFDKKLEQIEKHSKTAADALKNGFSSVVVDTSKLESAITSLANKISALNTAGNSVGNIGTAMNQVSKDATKAASSLSSVAQSINNVKPDNSLAKSVEQYRNISSQIEQVSNRQKQLNDIIKSYELTMSRIQSGKGGVIQAGQQQQVQDARKELEANNQLLATLRQKQQEIVNTNVAYQKQIQLVEQLKTYNQGLNSLPNQRSQQTLSDMREYYSELEKSSARAAKAAETARIKEEKERTKATEKAIKEAERKATADEKSSARAAKAAADLAKQQELAQRTTPRGALDYSKNAKSLRDQVNAINYLKQARLSLDTTDRNYQNTLNKINAAIARHNQALTDAGVRSQGLARNHRNLMDTAGQLQRKLALVFSVSQIEGYISKLASVRGEFELQQRSLQAILQNKSQADKIFNQTVQLAVKSPFQIKQLVFYTKQLAAYRIESDKLFDTTKRLADVSAGLGVDMGRLILAYGQVKAAAYLRGTEVRQFTEAGINLYGELQRYFQEVKGEAYTTAQIVDMISKRKVTFEDIENIFQRLTDKGGLFYNMQEIQAETLQGKISNLKDSIDVMLNSIGKDNEGVLKGSIDAVKYLIDNWGILAEVLKGVAAAFVIMKLESIRTSKSLIEMAISMNVVSGNSVKALKMTELLRLGFLKMGVALKAFGAAFMSNIWLVAIAALAKGVMEMISNYNEYNKSLEENTKRYNENMQPVNALIAKYNELSEAAEKAKKSQEKNFDSVKNRKEREDAVVQLAAKFREFNIDKQIGDVTKLDDKQLTEAFDKLKKEYRELQDYILGFANAYTEVNNRTTWNPSNWQDRLEGDSKDLQNAGDDMLKYSSRVSQMLDIVGSKYDTLNSKLRSYYNEVKNGPDTSKNESQTEWLIRAYNALVKINRESQVVSKEFSSNRFSLFDIRRSLNEFYSQRDEFFKEVDRLKLELDSKSLKDPVLLSIALDQHAIQLGWTELQKNLERQRLELPLIPELKSDKKKGGTDVNTKLQRDILSERVSLIKELNKEYEKLTKVMGSDKAAKTVMERYASSLKDVRMPKNIIGDSFLPNKENTAKALQEISKIISDFRKKQGAQKDAYSLLDDNDVENIKNQLDKTKQSIESMFNELDLYNKMKKEGFSDGMIKSLFGNLTTTENEIQTEIEKLAGKEGELWEKAYDDLNNRLKAKQDEMFKNRIEQYAQFINDFNNQIENKQKEFADYMKIARDMLNKTGDVKAFTDQVGNIISKYNQNVAKIETEKFKKSGTYIEMMGDLSIKSADELQTLIEKLEDFIAKSASNIPAQELKTYINRLNEANEQLDKVKHPFGKSFITEIKEIIELQNKYNAEKSYQEELLQKQIELEKELRDIESKRDIAKTNGDDTTNFENQIVDIQKLIQSNDNSIANSSAKLQGMSTQMGKMTQGAGAVIGIIDKIVKGIDDSIQSIADLFNEIKDIASSYGVDTESGGWQDLSIAMSSISEMSTNVSNSWNSFKSGDFMGAAVSGFKAVGSVIKGINAIHDAKYERRIKEQQRNIKKLGNAYDVLKEKMDNAWNTSSFTDMNKNTIQNVDAQIRSYQEMIRAEEDKKDTDWDRINEWQDAINELEKTKKELKQQAIEEMGGIGETNYKDAAQQFVQSWMDAFDETGDGLKGLEENFDEFIKNLVLKQATMRFAENRLKKLFDAIDLSVSEGYKAYKNGMDGTIELTRKELEKINEIAKEQLGLLDKDLALFFETIGYKGSGNAELSALTQSIQGITETTAEELASLLNSIRFFVSSQTSDTAAIRALLEARYGIETEYSDSNPMLVELRAQTGYLEQLTDYIGRVFAPSANSKGAGLRVYMQ